MNVNKIVLQVLLALLVCNTNFGQDNQRPNILFAFADDWGRCARVYSKADSPQGSKADTPQGVGFLNDRRQSFNDVVKTPHFDRLANEGVLFRQAFVSAPSCTPCRSALLSGQHFWRTGRGAILSGASWDASIPAFPLLLQKSGYHIGETYKVWSPGTPNDAPFGGGKFGYEKAGRRVNQFSKNVSQLIDQGVDLDLAKQEILAEVDRNFQSFLDARKPGQPFCYWYGPTNTHRKWIKGSGKKLWGIEPEDLKGKLPPFIPDSPEVREDFADYLGEVQAFDASFGVLLKHLEEIGELENTIIVASGDHGPPGFPHGKCNLYDFGSRVSLAIRWGGGIGGRVIEDLTSLTDLAPTFLDAAGVAIPDNMTGKSLLPILKSKQSGKIDKARDAIYIGRERHVDRARADFMPYPQRAIRTDDFLYIINFKPDRWPLGDPYQLSDGTTPSLESLTEETYTTLPDEDAGPTKAWLISNRDDPSWKPYFERAYNKRPREELYDLRSDPDQMVNVASESTYSQTRTELEKRLLDELTRTKDPRMIDDGKFFETIPQW